MNFFGHAVVASWADDRAGHLLGSMLPDFETMVRVPLIAVLDADVRRGIDLHHRTDQTFHGTPVFLALCAHALEELSERGVRRGTARAVGHIGSELFLDGWLTRERHHVDGYLAALETEAQLSLRWKDDGIAFSKLRTRLATWGAPREYADPPFVYARLNDALRCRPALSVLEEHAVHVLEFLPSFREMVADHAPELLHQLRDGLGLAD